jgi:preprotein translocase subunit SecD
MQKSVRNRGIVLLSLIVIGILFLAPTFFRDVFGNSWISRPISLGLDLKGGVHLVYQVLSKEAVKSRLLSIGQTIRSELREDKKIYVPRVTVDEKPQLEVYLARPGDKDAAREKIEAEHRTLRFVEEGTEDERVKLVYAFPPDEAARIERDAIKQAVEILRNRVDQFGVAEPLIQQLGTDQILLQMPGVSDVESVKKAVGRVARLEFRLVPPPGSEGTVKLKDRKGAPEYVEDQALMTGDAVDDARVGTNNAQVDVMLSLTNEGGKTFSKITGENVGRRLAIILDNVVYSSPVIREKISGGQASISGGFTFKEAHDLAAVLRTGALPASLNVMEERTVGPSLGRESIQKGLVAIVVAFLCIVVFMIFYYGRSGLVAVGSLVINLFLLIAGLSAFGATLSLPGLAGLALTLGMAVDSNVIIFERVRDELKRGASRDAAVESGFEKAMSAIIDSNVTTLISGLVLYALGSGPIRGFAVTLSIGIITTIYCATTVCKMAFDYFPLTTKKGLSI